mmetsp:Transcript_84426/g.162896  ORF Transcript_84426/g.162896 Transcript_84426/m.162896 type:complete len:221 (+) Transcript_84426:697-1359(+)
MLGSSGKQARSEILLLMLHHRPMNLRLLHPLWPLTSSYLLRTTIFLRIRTCYSGNQVAHLSSNCRTLLPVSWLALMRSAARKWRRTAMVLKDRTCCRDGVPAMSGVAGMVMILGAQMRRRTVTWRPLQQLASLTRADLMENQLNLPAAPVLPCSQPRWPSLELGHVLQRILLLLPAVPHLTGRQPRRPLLQVGLTQRNAANRTGVSQTLLQPMLPKTSSG